MEAPLSIEQLYASYKPLLFSLAYRMLGSVMDAEDIVQEAFLSLNAAPEPERIRSGKSYLCKIVTNRCIDRLRSAQKQRELYVGPWLPEPIVADDSDLGDDPLQAYVRNESVSTAYLLLLQQLSWVERAVFLLREVLQYEYDEIADIVGKSSTNCRQIFHRAKRSIGVRPPVDEEAGSASRKQTEALGEHTAQLVNRFVHALSTGDLGTLMNLLAKDAALYSDGGGKVRAAVRPILGAERIVPFLAGILEKAPPGFSYKTSVVNGQTGIVTYVDGEPSTVISFHVENDLLEAIYIVLNPDKLGNVR
ncbi:RNA polymerase sigma-70 factor [Paenibacillus hemerocallicola]|uniref:RNA polymerase sigma-70 factor n=1 Tax=Paenibacillus hemerocallicola TaxID=1172614 RepID=A0A5C4T0U4_9BACL|nr:RNA polymerase sigma-70 factor [Paenibacillus hemerocallicola]TNJ62624.1 RNA polymerase sigma-70 factor [Paenibacillus hemerocallicola]